MGFVFCLPIDLVFLSSVASCLQSESLDQSAWRPAQLEVHSARSLVSSLRQRVTS